MGELLIVRPGKYRSIRRCVVRLRPLKLMLQDVISIVSVNYSDYPRNYYNANARHQFLSRSRATLFLRSLQFCISRASRYPIFSLVFFDSRYPYGDISLRFPCYISVYPLISFHEAALRAGIHGYINRIDDPTNV